jgi:hypothetical protein
MKKLTILFFLLFAGLISNAQSAKQEPNNSFNSADYISKDNVKTGSSYERFGRNIYSLREKYIQ